MQSRQLISTARKTALVSALSACLFAGSAHAQSTVGDIYGTAAPSQVIQVQNLGSGASRQVEADKDGRYRVASLPIGRYKVNLQDHGQTVSSQEIAVVAGQSAQLNFAEKGSAGGAHSLETVTVSANALAAIDVTSVESRTTFSASELNDLPVPRNVVDIAALTPGTIKGDPVFGNLPSFGGSSVAENSYYINGFNVTNLFNNLSFSEVPFQAIDQLDVQTGGYGAQYGFSTGGVTSVVTKRGTNEWKGGVSWVFTPDFARENAPTTYRKNDTLYRNFERNATNDNVYSAWIGGPLIKDKLFLFGIFQAQQQTQTNYPAASGSGQGVTPNSATRNKFNNPYSLIKLDWNINDSNIVEYTHLNNTQHTTNNYFTAAYDESGTPRTTDYLGQRQVKSGGNTDILKYTNYLTDNLTLSAQYGWMNSLNSSRYISPDGTVTTYNGDINSPAQGCAYVIDARWSVTGANQTPVTNDPYHSCYTSTNNDIFGGKDQRKNWRIDLEWKLGNHSIAGGYSRDDWKSDAGSTYAGGALYYYQSQDKDVANDYVSVYNFRTGGSIKIIQKSWYLQDNWQISDRFLAYVGIRNDSFDNKNGAGQSFVKQTNIWQPRLGFSWDVLGDSGTKIFGTAGRYSLPVAANVALRAATSSYYTIQDWTYTGVDPVTGAPVLGDKIGDPVIVNGESGATPDPRSVADRNLRPYSQDEYILGVQHKINSDNDLLDGWVVGAKAIYRKLNNAIDDTCDWRPFYRYGQSLGLDMDANGDEFTPPPNTPGCFIYNPGKPLTLQLDLDGSGQLRPVTIPADQFGTKAKRSYQGIVLTAEKGNSRWYANVSYTWSRNYGNTEGLVKSDNGQTDTGTTQDFDYPELGIGSNGYLPNDRRHSFKAYGAYKFSPEWSVGLNVLVQSGRPKNCFGGGPGASISDGIPSYNSAYFWCEGEVAPRGSRGRTPWTWTMSPNVVFTPNWAKGLTLKLDMINIFNNTKPITVSEVGERQPGATPTTYYSTTYDIPTSYQTPRYFRLMAQYDFSL
ncbi:TonB-dependent receptor [Dyella koreensis]|uniref:TonB-dependent receptor n=1 Tax=Dyella koreensis TaxID=311235 RepID=A0ABW8K669_9GAMM